MIVKCFFFCFFKQRYVDDPKILKERFTIKNLNLKNATHSQIKFQSRLNSKWVEKLKFDKNFIELNRRIILTLKFKLIEILKLKSFFINDENVMNDGLTPFICGQSLTINQVLFEIAFMHLSLLNMSRKVIKTYKFLNRLYKFDN